MILVKADRLMKRQAACRYLSERLGQSVSLATIRRWPLRYRQIGRDAMYAENDLQKFVRKKLNTPYRVPFQKKQDR